MTRLFTLFIFSFLLFQNQNIAQTFCGSGGDEPRFACFVCGTGYVGNTGGYTADVANFNFPCGTIENSQWLAFEAGGTSAQVEVISGNCQNGNGVEAAIYSQSLQIVSNCYSSGGVNMQGVVSSNSLVPGQTYYVLIDGFGGDICDIAVNISGNQGYGLPLPPGRITRTGATDLCPGATTTYEVDPVPFAESYEWSVPQAGKIVGGFGTRKITVEWQTPGGGVVRVTPSNRCYTGLSSFKTELVYAIPPTLKAPEFLCPNEFPITRNGNTFDDFGAFTVNFTTTTGCDSMVTYSFLPKTSDPVILNRTLCPGECVAVGDSCYADAGVHLITLDTPQINGCDSVISLTINVLDSISINNFQDTLFCIDTCTAILPDITFAGQNLIAAWNTVAGNIAQTSGLNATICTAGDYFLTLTDTLSGLSCALETHVTGDTIALDSLRNIAVSGGTCASDTLTLTTDLLPTAGGYNWQLPLGATAVGSALGNSIKVVFSGAFSGDICVEAFNTCETSNLLCANVSVSAAPSSNFAASAMHCISDLAVVDYSGGAGAGATFDWNFGNATVVTGSGSGPYELEFATSGNYDISLSVVENGCTSVLTTKTITVENPLNAPTISCFADAESITFSWGAIAGATDYSATSLAGQAGNLNGLEYTVSGLTLGDSVTVEVGAISGGACPPSVSTLRCGTQNCPNVTVSVNDVIFCENDAFVPDFTATISGGMGNGTFDWNGPFVSSQGIILPDVPIGSEQVMVTYTEGVCDYQATVSYAKLEAPDLSGEAISPVWKPGVSGDIDIEISNSNNNSFLWSNGATTEDLVDVASGNYSVTVTNLDGCSATDNYTISTGQYALPPAVVICQGIGETVSVAPTAGADFVWTPNTGLSCNECPNPFVNPSQSTVYTVTAILPNGQSEATTIQAIVVPIQVCPSSRAVNSDLENGAIATAFSIENTFDASAPIEQNEKKFLTDFYKRSIQIFPNPAFDEINISSPFEVRILEVFDLTGKRLKLVENANQTDISDLAKGTYFIKIKSDEAVVVKRILKQ